MKTLILFSINICKKDEDNSTVDLQLVLSKVSKIPQASKPQSSPINHKKNAHTFPVNKYNMSFPNEFARITETALSVSQF